MATDPESYHYVRASGTMRFPRRHVFLDTEAHTVKTGKAYTQQWRVGVATFREAPKNRPARIDTRVYYDPGPLWTDVDAFAKPRHRTVLWTHNLGYDLRISGALEALPRMGWALEAWNMMPQGTWMVWRKDTRTLTMVDAAAVFPTSLAQLAKAFQTAKLPLPAEDAPADRWVSRCARDVQVLHDAVTAYLDWLERERLGSWQLTGTGQAWAAFRHRFLTNRMLVHWDEHAREAERRAIWTGRTEAYYHGVIIGTRVDEWDLTAAYPRIAKRHNVPTELVRTLPDGADMWKWVDRDGYAVLAEVDVVTDQPLVPTERDGRICWPVGTFTTTLWDPELRLLRDAGASVNVRRAWVYRAEPALQEWATWILKIVASKEDSVPAWVRLIAKHWGVALIGRCAMRRQQWRYLGETPRAACRWWHNKDLDTGEVTDLVQVGTSLWQSDGDADWSESMPAVTGWVTSRVREIMTRIWLQLGDQVALYMDTDSILVRAEHHHLVARIARRHPELGLRVKRSWRRVSIHGPRQIITDQRVRVSGVPVRAVKMPDGTLAGEVWESLRTAIASRRPSVVRISPRRWRLRGVDTRRLGAGDGWTRPVRLPA